MNTRFFLNREVCFGRFSAYIVREGGYMGAVRHIAQPVVFKEITDQMEAIVQPATLSFEEDAAQTLMDELWRVGIRPTEGTGSAGALAATQAHLKDMRALVTKLNKTPLP